MLHTFRTERGITMDKMADIIGTTRQTYSRIEKGDSELSLGQAVRLAEYFDITIDQLVPSDTTHEQPTDTDIDRTKYTQIIKNFIKHSGASDGKIPKTKLAKLCYLLDFSWYYEHGEPITHLQYRRNRQGPVPDAYFATLDRLQEEESIAIEHKGTTLLVSNISEPGDDRLNNEQKELLEKIASKRKKSSTQEIVNFTHEQLPRKLCDELELIPYELIIQEDPKHVF